MLAFVQLHRCLSLLLIFAEFAQFSLIPFSAYHRDVRESQCNLTYVRRTVRDASACMLFASFSSPCPAKMATTSASASGKPDRPPTPSRSRSTPSAGASHQAASLRTVSWPPSSAKASDVLDRSVPPCVATPTHRRFRDTASWPPMAASVAFPDSGARVVRLTRNALLQSRVQFDDKTGKIVNDCMLTSIPEEADDNDDESDAKNSSPRPKRDRKSKRILETIRRRPNILPQKQKVRLIAKKQHRLTPHLLLIPN